MECDIGDLTLSYFAVVDKELSMIEEFENSKKCFDDLLVDYQIAGAVTGTVLGILEKGTSEEQRDKLIDCFLEVMDGEIHPIDFWGNFERIILNRCLKLQECFFRIQELNSSKRTFSLFAKALVFAGNTLSGGLVGEAKTAFEGLFSLLSGISNKVSEPKNFEELCIRWIELSTCLTMVQKLVSRRIHYPIYGTRRHKANVWFLYYLQKMRGIPLNKVVLLQMGKFWDQEVKVVNDLIEDGVVDKNLNLVAEDPRFKGTYIDNTVPKRLWKDLKKFYDDDPLKAPSKGN